MTIQIRTDAWPDGRQYDQVAEIANQLEQLQALVIQALTLGKPYKLNTLGNFANDAAAAVGGVAIGNLYRNGSVIQVRVA